MKLFYSLHIAPSINKPHLINNPHLC